MGSAAFLQAVLDAIAKMAPDDRALAERVHVATLNSIAGRRARGSAAYASARATSRKAAVTVACT